MSHRNFCTFSYNSKSCDGDSGGPAVKINYGQYYLYGIISSSLSCGAYDEPTVLVSVAKFYKWIRCCIENEIDWKNICKNHMNI